MAYAKKVTLRVLTSFQAARQHRRHPERSRFSGGAKDLARVATAASPLHIHRDWRMPHPLAFFAKEPALSEGEGVGSRATRFAPDTRKPR